MIRSTRHVFTSFCLLNQGVRATGIAKHYAATITPIVELLMKEKVNIVQMMCPELIFDGFHRKPCGRSNYDTPLNHKICREVAQKTVWLMEMFCKNGHSVEAVIGIEFSPSCAVSRLKSSRTGEHQERRGIYIEELQKLMTEKDIEVPFIGVQTYRINDTLKELSEILRVDQDRKF